MSADIVSPRGASSLDPGHAKVRERSDLDDAETTSGNGGPRPAGQRRKMRGVRRKTVLVVVAMVVLAIPFVFPTWWMISSSLKSTSEILRVPPTLWPMNPDFSIYRSVFELQPFARQYWNSVYIAVVVTLGTMVVSSLAGYGFARIRFRGSNLLFLVVLAGLLVPIEVTIVPMFRAATAMGLYDTHWPLIIIPIFGAPSVLATFIMRQFFVTIPDELEEAGRIDGLGRWGVFRKVSLPLAGPALASVGIITFLKSWNMYLEPVVFLSSRENFTLPRALTQYVDAYGGPMWNIQLAATTLTAVPVLIVFIFAQRYFIQGLAQSGLKG